MKKKTSTRFQAFILIIAAAFLVSPGVAHSFWFDGPDIQKHVDDMVPGDTINYATKLHSLLEEIGIAYAPSFMNENNPYREEGVTVNQSSKTWNEYTLISDFTSTNCEGLPGAPEPRPSGGYCDEPGAGWNCCDRENPSPWFCRISTPTCAAILIDKDGNRVNAWPSGWGPAQMLPNGDVLVASVSGGFGFGGEGDVVQLDWNGNEINRWGAFHHDHQREGNPTSYYAPGLRASARSGITMYLTREVVSVEEQQSRVGTDPGDWPDIISNYDLEDDVIVQANWDGTTVWEWHAVDHFWPNPANGDLGLGFDANALEAIKNGPPIRGIEGGQDYTHVNACSWLGDNPWFKNGQDQRFNPENMIIDYRSMNIIAIIARYDHPDGLWTAGAIVCRFGPDFSAVGPDRKLGQIIGQHHAHMIPRGLPGWGNILVFDNGGSAGFGSYFPGMKDADGNPIGTYPATTRDNSRVLEFDPITREVVWDYVQAKPTADYDGDGVISGNDRKFFATHYSSAQRLKNGNTLIAEGNTGRVFEVTKEGEVVWEYFHPRNSFGIYRAYRVPEAWVYAGMHPEED